MRILVSLVLILCLPAIGNAARLYGLDDCELLGGKWAPAHAPRRTGSCTLTRPHTVLRNERLEVGTNVDLVLANNAVLTIEGELLIIDTAIVFLDGASLINNNQIDINNKGELTLKSGGIQNNGLILSEGKITINNVTSAGQPASGGIFNYDTITNFSGGEIHNYGRILSVGIASINTEALSVFTNYLGGQYHAGADNIGGQLINEGYVSVGSGLIVNQGGVVNNAGFLSVGYGELRGEKGSRITTTNGGAISVGSNQLVGKIIANGEFSNAGAIWLEGTLMSTSTIGDQLRGTNNPIINAASGSIQIYPTGEISIQDNVLINAPGASINNNGKIALSCFSAFKDDGSFTGNAILQGCFIPPVVPPSFPKQF